jgi:hypothetical protein
MQLFLLQFGNFYFIKNSSEKLQQIILKILESIGFKILRFKRLPSSISFQKSKYQIKEFKIFDV